MDIVSKATGDGGGNVWPPDVPAMQRYLASLEASWRALAAVDSGALVRRAPGHLISRRPRHPVLSNAVILDPGDRDAVLATFAGQSTWAVWSGDEEVDASLAAAGLHRDVVTVPMLAHLCELPPALESRGSRVLRVSAARVAEINGSDPGLLEDVPGLHAWASVGGESGLILQRMADDVHVSFVATQARARRQGLATSVLFTALLDARDSGACTATLSSTMDGRRLYESLGFRPLGRWQEWVAHAQPG